MRTRPAFPACIPVRRCIRRGPCMNAALDPVETIGAQLKRVLRHSSRPGWNWLARAKPVWGRCGPCAFPTPKDGCASIRSNCPAGCAQRVMMALALACDPQLLIADEATTGLDAASQKAVLDLLSTLVRQRGMSALLITHDLAVASQFADRIVVMHAGQVVESAPASELVRRPFASLYQAVAGLISRSRTHARRSRSGRESVPNLRTAQPSCRFSGRCDLATEDCRSRKLPEVAVRDLHVVRCQEYGR